MGIVAGGIGKAGAIFAGASGKGTAVALAVDRIRKASLDFCLMSSTKAKRSLRGGLHICSMLETLSETLACRTDEMYSRHCPSILANLWGPTL